MSPEAILGLVAIAVILVLALLSLLMRLATWLIMSFARGVWWVLTTALWLMVSVLFAPFVLLWRIVAPADGEFSC